MTLAWLVHRKASTDDRLRLQRTAFRFAQKLDIPYASASDHEIVDVVETYLSQHIGAQPTEGLRLRRTWRKRVRRALRHSHADGIAHGYVGRYCDE
jgi:hypothetical protein